MTQELNLSTAHAVALILLLLPLLWRLYRHMGRISLEYKAKDTEVAQTPTEDNQQPYGARYGAYMQSQGNYHN